MARAVTLSLDEDAYNVYHRLPYGERSRLISDFLKGNVDNTEIEKATPAPSPKTQLQPPKEKESTGKQSSGGSEESGTDYNPTEATPTSEDKPQLDTLDQLLRSS